MVIHEVNHSKIGLIYKKRRKKNRKLLFTEVLRLNIDASSFLTHYIYGPIYLQNTLLKPRFKNTLFI